MIVNKFVVVVIAAAVPVVVIVKCHIDVTYPRYCTQQAAVHGQQSRDGIYIHTMLLGMVNMVSTLWACLHLNQHGLITADHWNIPWAKTLSHWPKHFIHSLWILRFYSALEGRPSLVKYNPQWTTWSIGGCTGVYAPNGLINQVKTYLPFRNNNSQYYCSIFRL